MKKLKILLLSFYYYPDLCAGSFRAEAFVNELKKRNNSVSEIDVITTIPNRYKSYKKSAKIWTKHKNCKIHRISLPNHNSGMIDQAYSFIFFSINVLKFLKEKKYDVVFVTSSRLMTAFLGALINRNMKAYLYLDIRDLFRDTIYEILPKPVSFFILPIVKLIEKFTFCSSSKINLVSVGFNSYVKKILRNNSEIQITNFSNGIDDQFLKKSFKVKKKFNSTIKTILFAGNIGEGQGLHKIIPEVAMQLKDCIRFKVIGDGGAFLKLKNKIKSFNIGNVDLIKPMSRNELCDYYLKADILFVHLNNNEAFKKVIPSKLYEYASIGKPILAGLEGVSHNLVKREIDGTELFKPCDVKSFISAYNKLIKKGRFYNRLTFKKKYSRKHIMKKMIDDLLVDIKV